MRENRGIADPQRRLVGLCLALATVVVALVVAGNAGAAWDQYRGNGARTASATWQGSTGPSGVVAWRAAIGRDAMIDASPVVNPNTGVIYVGTVRSSDLAPRSRLLAFYPTGSLQWAASLSRYNVRSAPSVRRDGFPVVVGQKATRVVSHATGESWWKLEERSFFVDQFTGAIRSNSASWPVPYGAGPLVDPRVNGTFTVHPSGLIVRDWSYKIVGNYKTWVGVDSDVDWCFWCIDFDKSAPASLPSGSEPPLYPRLASPALSEQCNDVVWTHGGNASRASLATGRGRFLDAAPRSTPALGGAGRMYAVVEVAGSLRLRAIDWDGDIAWTSRSLGTGTASPPALGRARGSQTNAYCERVRDGVLTKVYDNRSESAYLTVGDKLYAINETGSIRWTRIPGGTRLGEPVVIRSGSSELVVVPTGAPNPSLLALDDNGNVLWRLPLDAPALGSPAVANGHIYLATTNSLYAVR